MVVVAVVVVALAIVVAYVDVFSMVSRKIVSSDVEVVVVEGVDLPVRQPGAGERPDGGAGRTSLFVEAAFQG